MERTDYGEGSSWNGQIMVRVVHGMDRLRVVHGTDRLW